MDKTIHTREYAVLLRLLRQIREDAGITQVELSRRLDETQSAISKIERGERRIDVLELRIICRALGLTLPRFVARLERALDDEG